MSQAVDPTRCPLCGGPNACVRAVPGSAAVAECWCAARSFAPRLFEVVPREALGRACICRGCQEAAAEVREPD
jgi:hypothetical protein